MPTFKQALRPANAIQYLPAAQCNHSSFFRFNRPLTTSSQKGKVRRDHFQGGFSMKKALVSVTGVDRPGIIAKVSTALYEMNVNVLEISQTILDGYFTMLMIVDMTACTAAFEEVVKKLNTVGEELGELVQIQRADIFDAMHRI
jgi:ACT domain-containing protein